MRRKHNEELLPFAKELRQEMTAEERKLWFTFLRCYPVRFKRQKILGYYIADFYCAKAKLVIELDGSQHYLENGPEQDAQRTDFLAGYGLTVLRIPNNAVHQNFSGVCEAIDLEVKKRIENYS
jgi:very-short-patch-repair endonuclease